MDMVNFTKKNVKNYITSFQFTVIQSLNSGTAIEIQSIIYNFI